MAEVQKVIGKIKLRKTADVHRLPNESSKIAAVWLNSQMKQNHINMAHNCSITTEEWVG